MSTNNTVQISVSYSSKLIEAIAASTITPGDIIEYTSAGTVRGHTVANGTAAKIFAIENTAGGGGINDDYLAASRVYAKCLLPGDVVWAWLATAQVIVIGDFLTSAGLNGDLKKASTPAANSIIGIALEAVTTVASIARLKVQIM